MSGIWRKQKCYIIIGDSNKHKEEFTDNTQVFTENLLNILVDTLCMYDREKQIMADF